jgi:large subunit ribosomal protein L9
MQVILLKDVRKIGKKFEVKSVANGYALNFLIPNKLAEASTASALKRAEQLKSKEVADQKIHEDQLTTNLKALEGSKIELKENANEKGHLFKGVNKEEIAEAIKKQLSLDFIPEYIVLEKPIKEVGDHTVEAKVQDKSAKFKLSITAE